MSARSNQVWSVLAVGLAAFVGGLGFAAPAHAAGKGATIKARDAETERGTMKIALYEKWNPLEEKNWKQNGKVVLLVHGATWSSHCTFDPVEGYSLMDALAEQGYDVWALDLHGYGKSGKTSRDWSESTAVAADIDAAADYIRALRWVERIHVVGYQWGSQPTALFASQHSNKVGKVVLFGMRYQLTEKKTQPQDQYRKNGDAMLRPEDGDLDSEFVRRRAQVCQQYDAKSPNGALIDLTQPSPVDPQKMKNAVLMLSGEKEADQNELGDRLEFFRNLGSHTRTFTVLSGLGKHAVFERGRNRFEAAIAAFLDQP